MRTHLIHGNYESKKWDYDHHVVPPVSASTTYRLSSAHRGAQGFVEFAGESMDFKKHVPIKNENAADDTGGRAERFIDYVAEHAYTITLAVSLGQMKTLIESPYSMTHAALPEVDKRSRGLEAGGIRLSIGLEGWHDLIEDLEDGLDHV